MLTDSERAARHAAAQETRRTAQLAALRDLLEFLERNPDVPFTAIDVLYFPPHISDELDRDVVDDIAVKLDVIPGTQASHYIAERRFGYHVSFRAVAIPAEKRGASQAREAAVTA